MATKNVSSYTVRMPLDLALKIQERAKERGEKPVQTIRGLLHMALDLDSLKAEMLKIVASAGGK